MPSYLPVQAARSEPPGYEAVHGHRREKIHAFAEIHCSLGGRDLCGNVPGLLAGIFTTTVEQESTAGRSARDVARAISQRSCGEAGEE